VFDQFGDLVQVMLRRGNQHSAKFRRRLLLPVIARYGELDIPRLFRSDVAFASPKLMTVLEAEKYWYAIRLMAYAVLERQIAHLLKRPVGRPRRSRRSSTRGPSVLLGLRRAARSGYRHLFMDMVIRPVSNGRLGRPGGVPDAEFNPHLEIPG